MKQTRILFFYSLVILFSKVCRAQNNSTAFTAGVASAGISEYHPWNTFQNPAANVKVKKIFAGIAHTRNYLIKDLSTSHLLICWKIKSGQVISLSAQQSGFEGFFQKDYRINYSTELSPKLSAGISLCRYSFRINDPENISPSSYYACAGIIATPLSYLSLGAAVSNPGAAYLNKETKELIPFLISLGSSVRFSEQVVLLLTLKQNGSYPTSIHSGIEYAPKKDFRIRCGIQTQPLVFCYGFQLDYKKFNLAFSIQYHPEPGLSPYTAISHEF